MWLGAVAAGLSAFGAAPFDPVDMLVIQHADGTTASFPLSDGPVLTFRDGVLTAKSPRQETSVAFGELADFHFAAGSGVETVDAPDLLTLRNGIAYLSGLGEGSRVNVCDITGVLLDTFGASPEGTLEIDLRRYSRGVLILQTEHGSYKINNR